MESAIDQPAQPETPDEAERRRDLLVESSKLDSPSRARAFSWGIQQVDWFLVIVALERKGYTAYTMACKSGVARSTLNGWKCGLYQPMHHGGERLISLWMVETGLPREELPMRVVDQLSAARVK